MRRNQARMGDRLQLAIGPELKRAVESSAKSFKLDTPAYVRLVLAVAVQQGITFGGPKKSPVGTGEGNG